MNILFITQEDYLAGSTYSVSYLAKGLAALGHRVVVVAREESLLLRLMVDTPVIAVPITIHSRTDVQALLKLKQVVERFEIDIINAQSSYDRYLSVFVKWFFRRQLRVVHTRRQISMSVGGWLQNWIYVDGTEKIVAVSEQVKQSLVDQGFPNRHVEVIQNGTPHEKYQIDSDKVRALRIRLGIAENDFVIGCISRKKLQSQLIRSLHLISFPVKVILIGVDQDGELKELADQLPLRHQVYFEGRIEGREALHYYPLFTVNALCSVTEGLSQSLLEAMYMRIPVVATAAAGNLDLIAHGTDGLLFENGNIKELADCLVQLANDDRLRQELADRAFEKVSTQFSMHRVINEYESLFYRLVYDSGNQVINWRPTGFTP